MKVLMVCTKDAPKSWRYEPTGIDSGGVKGTLYVPKGTDGFSPQPPRYIIAELSIPENVGDASGTMHMNLKGVHPNYAAADPLKF